MISSGSGLGIRGAVLPTQGAGRQGTGADVEGAQEDGEGLLPPTPRGKHWEFVFEDFRGIVDRVGRVIPDNAVESQKARRDILLRELSKILGQGGELRSVKSGIGTIESLSPAERERLKVEIEDLHRKSLEVGSE